MEDPTLPALADALGHRFADPGLLADAVTHPSLAGMATAPRGGASYERLEFLGDRVLGLVVAEWLLERHPDEREGALAKRHAGLVNRDALGRVAEGLGLGEHLRLSPGESASGGRTNRTILADACEAVIGALYLDGGLPAASAFIRGHWTALMERGAPPPSEPKTALQEWAQGRGRALPVYDMLERTGPDHDPLFRVRVTVDGVEPVVGTGGSKRAAEKDAATLLLAKLGVNADG